MKKIINIISIIMAFTVLFCSYKVYSATIITELVSGTTDELTGSCNNFSASADDSKQMKFSFDNKKHPNENKFELIISAPSECNDDTWNMNDFDATGSERPLWNKISYVRDPNNHQDAKPVVLVKITIEEGIKTVGKNVFYGQSDITEINLPSTITSIGDSAFNSLNASKVKINFAGTAAQWNSIAIGDNNDALSNTYKDLVKNKVIVAKKGDVDYDGVVSKTDAISVAQVISRNSEGTELNADAFDANGDGVVDVCDCVKICVDAKKSAK